MKKVSSLAVAAALIVAGACAVSPAAGQRVKSAEQEKQRGKAPKGVITQTATGKKLVISKEAEGPLRELEAAVKARSAADFAAKLPIAEAAAKSADEKYVLAQFRLQHALNAKDVAAQAAALDAILASGATPPAELAGLYQNIGNLAHAAGNMAKADAAYTKMVELSGNKPDALAGLARLKIDQKKNVEALALIEQAIAAQKAAGQPVLEAWYRNALQLAYGAKMGSKAVALSRDVFAAYPTTVNWRNALVVHRDTVQRDDGLDLDTLRLMRASKAISEKSEYVELARLLATKGYPGEAKQVLDEAVRANLINLGDASYKALVERTGAARIAADRAALAGLERNAQAAATGGLALSTGEALLGYNEHAKAAAMFRTAIQKGGIDTNVASLRLGIALALAGNKAEAAAAFKTVTGPRAEIASLWLLWLTQPMRPAAA